MNSMIRELTSLRRLDRESAPRGLYEKAKRLGTWNPSDIELTCGREGWARLTDAERDIRARAGPVRRIRDGSTRLAVHLRRRGSGRRGRARRGRVSRLARIGR